MHLSRLVHAPSIACLKMKVRREKRNREEIVRNVFMLNLERLYENFYSCPSEAILKSMLPFRTKETCLLSCQVFISEEKYISLTRFVLFLLRHRVDHCRMRRGFPLHTLKSRNSAKRLKLEKCRKLIPENGTIDTVGPRSVSLCAIKVKPSIVIFAIDKVESTCMNLPAYESLARTKVSIILLYKS